MSPGKIPVSITCPQTNAVSFLAAQAGIVCAPGFYLGWDSACRERLAGFAKLSAFFVDAAPTGFVDLSSSANVIGIVAHGSTFPNNAVRDHCSALSLAHAAQLAAGRRWDECLHRRWLQSPAATDLRRRDVHAAFRLQLSRFGLLSQVSRQSEVFVRCPAGSPNSAVDVTTTPIVIPLPAGHFNVLNMLGAGHNALSGATWTLTVTYTGAHSRVHSVADCQDQTGQLINGRNK